jgi:hypothetical protein
MPTTEQPTPAAPSLADVLATLEKYTRMASGNVEYWRAQHTRGAATHERAYERDVVALTEAARRLRTAARWQAGAWFAGVVLNEWRECPGDIDGGDVQEWLTDAGLLQPTEMSEPCSEECDCAGFGADFPTDCYRITDAGFAAINLHVEDIRTPEPT